MNAFETKLTVRIYDIKLAEKLNELYRRTEFSWYMNFLPREKENLEEYQCVWNFTLNFEQAKAYRKLKKGMLRSNQWEDLTVHVYI